MSDQIFSAALAQAFGWAVVHSLWQIALVWAIFKLFELRFQHRHQLVYLLSLAAMLVSTVWSAGTFWLELERSKLAATPSSSAEILPVMADNAEVGAAAGYQQGLDAGLPEQLQHWLGGHAAQIGWAWLICAGLLWLRLLGGWWLAQRLRRRGVAPVGTTFQELCNQWANRLKIKAKIETLESPYIAEPLTLGFWKPVVLFPAGMLLQLSPAQTEALLLHELAHIRRHDYLVNLAQLVLEVCFFYHPLFWLLSREARSRREFCCDEVVLKHTPDPMLYARTLTDLQLSLVHPQTQFVMNATGKSRFTERILHIAGISPKRSARPNFLLALFLPLALALSSWWPAAELLPETNTALTSENVRLDTLPPQKTVVRKAQVRQEAQPAKKAESAQSSDDAGDNAKARIAIEAVKMNVFYIGVDNPLRVAASGVPASDLRVQLIGNGSVSGDNGNYLVRVVQPGEVTIRVLQEVKGEIKMVTDQKYRVKRIPDPTPWLSGLPGKTQVQYKDLLESEGIIALLQNFDFDAVCEVLSFEITVLPKEQNPISFTCTGSTIPSQAKEIFKSLEKGGAVYFDDIKGKCPGDMQPRNFGGLAIKVKPNP